MDCICVVCFLLPNLVGNVPIYNEYIGHYVYIYFYLYIFIYFFHLCMNMDRCQLTWLESFKLTCNEIMRIWANAIPLKHSPSTRWSRWRVFPLVHFVLRVAVPVGSEDSEDLKCFGFSWYLLMFVLSISGVTPQRFPLINETSWAGKW